MRKIIGSLVWLIMLVLEVIISIIGYALGLVYLVYRIIKGKRTSKIEIIDFNKKAINDLAYVLNEYLEMAKHI